MLGKFVILMDGAFVKKKIQNRTNKFPTVSDIKAEVARIRDHHALREYSLLRAYFYDAPPPTGALINPVSGATVDLGAHPNNAKHISLQQTLELQSDFEVRLGETAVFGWTVGIAATRSLQKSPRMPSADDFVLILGTRHDAS